MNSVISAGLGWKVYTDRSPGYNQMVRGLPINLIIVDWSNCIAGSRYNACREEMMGSRIAGGFILVGTVITCFNLWLRLRIGDKFSLLVSPAMIKWRLEPYFGARK